jgi:hypothetical protein
LNFTVLIFLVNYELYVFQLLMIVQKELPNAAKEKTTRNLQVHITASVLADTNGTGKVAQVLANTWFVLIQ